MSEQWFTHPVSINLEEFLGKQWYILCASGYAEEPVQEARKILSGIGITPTFLGLKTGRIDGDTGGRVFAEVLISQLLGEGERPLPTGLFLAGGVACGQHLLADPRVHLLVCHMLSASRPVGWLRPVCYPLFELLAKKVDGASFLLQETQPTADFITAFVQRFDNSGQVEVSA